MNRKLVAAIACRNQGSRLYGKPIQNLDVQAGVTILDNIIGCLTSISCIDEIVLGISDGIENEVFKKIASQKNLQYIIGDETDVLARLVSCGKLAGATDIFRVTSESPFLYFEPVEEVWQQHQNENLDASLYDEGVDGTGFEIIALNALARAHEKGESRHRSELCSLYIRENLQDFAVVKHIAPEWQIRKDLRLTVDNPEDLSICRRIYGEFKTDAPRFSLRKIITYLDNNPQLKELVAPFTETGYATMNL